VAIIRLLDNDEPPAFETLNSRARSPFFLICDHAGNRLPRSIGSLGLQDDALGSHIAWDIGAAAVTRLVAQDLNAPAILQTYSRLVIDCNRTPDSDASIVEISEYTTVPGNLAISREQRDLRRNEVFRPYHAQISSELDWREIHNIPTVLVSLHSFTPVFKGARRPWHVGILYNEDKRMAKPMMSLLRSEVDLVVGDNEPYALDENDYSIPLHAARRGLPHIEIEIRQDLIGDERGQRLWAERIKRYLISSWKQLEDRTLL
jgi:predicted N-formylglutamate amidohydrolase